METFITIDASDNASLLDMGSWIGGIAEIGTTNNVRYGMFQGRPVMIIKSFIYDYDGDLSEWYAWEWSAQFGAACQVQITYSEPAIWDLI